MSMRDFRRQRKMAFVRRGMRVLHTYNDRYGKIVRSNTSGNLDIKFDGDNYTINCHPFFMMTYFDKNGDIIKEYGK